jgi:hypothetical protein
MRGGRIRYIALMYRIDATTECTSQDALSTPTGG